MVQQASKDLSWADRIEKEIKPRGKVCCQQGNLTQKISHEQAHE